MPSTGSVTFDVEALLANPTGLPVGLDAESADAIATAALAAVVNDLTGERWTACGNLLGAIAQIHPTDTVYASAQSWARYRPDAGYPSTSAVEALVPMVNARSAANQAAARAASPAAPSDESLTV